MKPMFLIVFASFFAIAMLAGQQPAANIGAAGVPQDPAAVGYLNLHQRHPDSDPGPIEFNRGYSAALAMQRMTQVEGFLASFYKLTEKVRNRLSAAELHAIGNADSDIQTIGFRNIPLVIEGTLLKQEYQLRQVEYELAQIKQKSGQGSAADVAATRTAYAQATKALQVFWDTKLPTD